MALKKTLLVGKLLVASFCAMPAVAYAVLGGAPTPMEQLLIHPGGTRVFPVPGQVSYTIHEYKGNEGKFAVREFADDSGRVFAVDWLGYGVPRFDEMFGAYYEELRSASLFQRSTNSWACDTDTIDFWMTLGKNYYARGHYLLPQHMPAGFDRKQLRGPYGPHLVP